MNGLYGNQVMPEKYVHQNYPRELRKAGEPAMIVHSAEEESAAMARGFSTKPLLVAHHVGSPPPMTTPVATQNAYNDLLREMKEKVDLFNKQFAELQFKHDEWKAKYQALDKEHSALQRAHNKLKEAGEKKSKPDEGITEVTFSQMVREAEALEG